MRQLMPQPWKQPKTGVCYFRKIVPERLRPLGGRREIEISLRTKNLCEAKLHYPEAAARVDQMARARARTPKRRPPHRRTNRRTHAPDGHQAPTHGVLANRLEERLS